VVSILVDDLGGRAGDYTGGHQEQNKKQTRQGCNKAIATSHHQGASLIIRHLGHLPSRSRTAISRMVSLFVIFGGILFRFSTEEAK